MTSQAHPEPNRVAAAAPNWLLEGLEGPECLVDGRGQIARGGAATTGREDIPEEGVVVVPASVVSTAVWISVGKAVETPEDLLGIDGMELGMSLQGLVEVGRIGPMVLLVVDLHGPGVDMGLQGVVGISELGKLEGIGHGSDLLSVVRFCRVSPSIFDAVVGSLYTRTKKVLPYFPLSPRSPRFQVWRRRCDREQIERSRRSCRNRRGNSRRPLATRILLVDCDMFYVQVARLEDPDGVGQEELLIVGGSPTGRGVVTSASYSVREFGVRSGMPTAQALKLCPQGQGGPGFQAGLRRQEPDRSERP